MHTHRFKCNSRNLPFFVIVKLFCSKPSFSSETFLVSAKQQTAERAQTFGKRLCGKSQTLPKSYFLFSDGKNSPSMQRNEPTFTQEIKKDFLFVLTHSKRLDCCTRFEKRLKYPQNFSVTRAFKYEFWTMSPKRKQSSSEMRFHAPSFLSVTRAEKRCIATNELTSLCRSSEVESSESLVDARLLEVDSRSPRRFAGYRASLRPRLIYPPKTPRSLSMRVHYHQKLKFWGFLF